MIEIEKFLLKINYKITCYLYMRQFCSKKRYNFVEELRSVTCYSVAFMVFKSNIQKKMYHSPKKIFVSFYVDAEKDLLDKLQPLKCLNHVKQLKLALLVQMQQIKLKNLISILAKLHLSQISNINKITYLCILGASFVIHVLLCIKLTTKTKCFLSS